MNSLLRKFIGPLPLYFLQDVVGVQNCLQRALRVLQEGIQLRLHLREKPSEATAIWEKYLKNIQDLNY